MLEQLLKIFQQDIDKKEPELKDSSDINGLVSRLKFLILKQKLSSQLTENEADSIKYDLYQIIQLLETDKDEMLGRISKFGSVAGISPSSMVSMEVLIQSITQEQITGQQRGGGLGGLLGGLFGDSRKSFGPPLSDSDDPKTKK